MVKATCPVWGALGEIPLSQGSMDAVLRLHAVTFLVIALIAAVFGFAGIAGAAAGIAQILFYIFLVIFLISLVMGLVRGRTRV